MLIAFQGEPGAYSEAAALTYSPGTQVLPCPSFEDVFAAVNDGPRDARHPADGELHRRQHPPQLRPAHRARAADHRRGRAARGPLPAGPARDPGRGRPRRLLASAGAGAVERALSQMRGVEVVAVYDTAGAAKMVRDGGLADAAAVASRRAGEVFGLTVLRESIQDFADNITRFCVIAKRRPRSPTPTRPRSSSPSQPARRPLQGPGRVRAARHQPDQARIASPARPPLGIRLLRGRRGPPDQPRLRAGPRGISRNSPTGCGHWGVTAPGRHNWIR